MRQTLRQARHGMTALEYAVIAGVLSLAVIGIFTASGGDRTAWIAAAKAWAAAIWSRLQTRL